RVPHRRHRHPPSCPTRRSSDLAIWREHGALEYRECVGDDLEIDEMVSFPQGIKAQSDETVIFAWIVFKSRAHRDRVNARAMQDRSEEHTSALQSRENLVCRLLL